MHPFPGPQDRERYSGIVRFAEKELLSSANATMFLIILLGHDYIIGDHGQYYAET